MIKPSEISSLLSTKWIDLSFCPDMWLFSIIRNNLSFTLSPIRTMAPTWCDGLGPHCKKPTPVPQRSQSWHTSPRQQRAPAWVGRFQKIARKSLLALIWNCWVLNFTPRWKSLVLLTNLSFTFMPIARWYYQMVLLSGVIRWYHQVVLLSGITRWYRQVVSPDDITKWYY